MSNTSKVCANRTNLLKSPSDTTLYSPGLRKANIEQNVEGGDNLIIEKISTFVDNIRLNDRSGRSGKDYPSAAAGSSAAASSGGGEDHHRSDRSEQRRRDTFTGKNSTTDRNFENRSNSTFRGNIAEEDEELRTERTTDQLLLQAE